MKLYLAGPMRGVPYFNFPAFFDAQARLEAAGHTVFNPAMRDVEVGFDWENCPDGSNEELANHDFSLREALGADTAFICAEADGIFVLSGWERSSGARAEVALTLALVLPVFTGIHKAGLVQQDPTLRVAAMGKQVLV